MTNPQPKKIAIIGRPGSGKSTFSLKLGKILNIPVHHLDNHIFDGKKKRNKHEMIAIKKDLLKEKVWIIEGCSYNTLEMRFADADTVIFLNFSRLQCLWRVCKRVMMPNEELSQTGCIKGISLDLVKYIWNFDKDKRKIIEDLRKKYPHVQFLMFHSFKEMDCFLKKIEARAKLNLKDLQ